MEGCWKVDFVSIVMFKFNQRLKLVKSTVKEWEFMEITKEPN